MWSVFLVNGERGFDSVLLCAEQISWVCDGVGLQLELVSSL